MLQLLIVSIGFLIVGFHLYKRHFVIKDTQTSRIDSVAIGEDVEVKCSIYNPYNDLINAPMSGKECVTYIWTITEKSSDHELINCRLFSPDPCIYLSDGGERTARLWMKDIEFDPIESDGKIVLRSESDIPPFFKVLISKHKRLNSIKSGVSFRDRYYEISEYCLNENNPLYVLGKTKIFKNYPNQNDEKITIGNESRNRELRSDLKQPHIDFTSAEEIGKILKFKKVLLSLKDEESIYYGYYNYGFFGIFFGTAGILGVVFLIAWRVWFDRR